MENIMTSSQKEVVDAITQGQKVYCDYYFRPKDEVCVLIESPKFHIPLNDNFYDFVYNGFLYSTKFHVNTKIGKKYNINVTLFKTRLLHNSFFLGVLGNGLGDKDGEFNIFHFDKVQNCIIKANKQNLWEFL